MSKAGQSRISGENFIKVIYRRLAMYINEFWCGVLLTLFIECLAVVLFGIITTVKNKENKNDK